MTTRSAADSPWRRSRYAGPSAQGSRRHRYAIDEYERLFDPRRLR